MARNRRPNRLPLTLPFFEDIDTTFGIVRLEPETDGSYTVIIDGMESSHIPPDPENLVFEYMRWIASIITTTYPSESPLNIAHLGGGAASLPRALAHHFPHSRNSVVELDAKLISLVREWVDLPASPRVAIREGDAFTVLPTLRSARFDIVIRDVFSHSRTPLPMRSLEAGREQRRILKDDGMFLANIAMDRDQRELADEIVTLREAFGDIELIAEPSAIKKRRRSNCIAVYTPGGLSAAARRAIRTDAVTVRTLDQKTVDRLASGGTIVELGDDAGAATVGH